MIFTCISNSETTNARNVCHTNYAHQQRSATRTKHNIFLHSLTHKLTTNSRPSSHFCVLIIFHRIYRLQIVVASRALVISTKPIICYSWAGAGEIPSSRSNGEGNAAKKKCTSSFQCSLLHLFASVIIVRVCVGANNNGHHDDNDDHVVHVIGDDGRQHQQHVARDQIPEARH